MRKDGANLVVEVEGAERGRVPLHLLDGVVSFSRAGMSPALMAACAEAGITLSHLDPTGRFLACVEGARSGNVLMRRTQYRAADNPVRQVPIVRAIVAAKAANQRTVLRRALRDHAEALAGPPLEALEFAERRLTVCGRQVLGCADVVQLRGFEGEAAGVYFGVFDHLVRVDGEAFRFGDRSRRPPLDRVNALLSFLYAMLGHDCRSALEAHGLDPQVGSCTRTGRADRAWHWT